MAQDISLDTGGTMGGSLDKRWLWIGGAGVVGLVVFLMRDRSQPTNGDMTLSPNAMVAVGSIQQQVQNLLGEVSFVRTQGERTLKTAQNIDFELQDPHGTLNEVFENTMALRREAWNDNQSTVGNQALAGQVVIQGNEPIPVTMSGAGGYDPAYAITVRSGELALAREDRRKHSLDAGMGWR